MDKKQAVAKLSSLVQQINITEFKNASSPEFIKWKRSVEVAITHIFGEDSRHLNDFKIIRYTAGFATGRDYNVDFNNFKRGLGKAQAVLQSMVEEITEYWSDSEEYSEKADYKIPPSNKNTIFLAYSYRPDDDELVSGFKELLKDKGYTVLDGKADRLGSISKAILDKIGNSETVIIVMTKRDKKENGKYTTAAWLLEEKGAALALAKNVAMFVEEGIDENDIGQMQGDSQRFHFTRNNFLKKIMEFTKCME